MRQWRFSKGVDARSMALSKHFDFIMIFFYGTARLD
jgi:hypothetical protein